MKGKDSKQTTSSTDGLAKGTGLNVCHSRSNNKLSDATFGIDENLKENVQTNNIAANI